MIPALFIAIHGCNLGIKYPSCHLLLVDVGIHCIRLKGVSSLTDLPCEHKPVKSVSEENPTLVTYGLIGRWRVNLRPHLLRYRLSVGST